VSRNKGKIIILVRSLFQIW